MIFLNLIIENRPGPDMDSIALGGNYISNRSVNGRAGTAGMHIVDNSENDANLMMECGGNI